MSDRDSYEFFHRARYRAPEIIGSDQEGEPYYKAERIEDLPFTQLPTENDNMKSPKRRTFTEDIKKHIVKNCPALGDARAAIELWEQNKKAHTPFEHGVFAMCDHVAKDLDQQPEGSVE